jgi:predicted dehydrogenase
MTAVPAAWATLEDCHYLRDTVEGFGLNYMLCETGYYQPEVMAARDFYREGAFGELYYCESEYQHPRRVRPDQPPSSAVTDTGKRTWRYGMAPMHYPTHNTAKLISVTGERLTHVSCYGWGDDSPSLRDNPQGNPFWDETALFTTDRGHAFRLKVWWHGAFRFAQRAEWNGDKMSLHMEQANGEPTKMVKSSGEVVRDSVGYAIAEAEAHEYKPPVYWETDLLPEPLRHRSGHWGSHCFLTHEFIDAVARERRPSVDLYEALAYTAPGIVAHESAMRGGERLAIPGFDR